MQPTVTNSTKYRMSEKKPDKSGGSENSEWKMTSDFWFINVIVLFSHAFVSMFVSKLIGQRVVGFPSSKVFHVLKLQELQHTRF